MCGVLGIQGHVSPDTVRHLFLQSQIRGRHATGVTYFKNGDLITIKEPVAADEFLEKHNVEDWFDNGKINMIGHCRYSTSDLEYNQPIYNDDMSVVHNGVMSQELPEAWHQLYGYDCETKNDTELLLHTLNSDKDPFEDFPDSSISYITLDKFGKMHFSRNGKRPLWYHSNGGVTIVTSTRNIGYRAGIKEMKRVNYNGEDLQP